MRRIFLRKLKIKQILILPSVNPPKPLNVKRSARLSKQIKENASILNLVQLWKDEESREKLIKLAELRKSVLKEEVENLSSMDEVKSRILGLSEEEVLNG